MKYREVLKQAKNHARLVELQNAYSRILENYDQTHNEMRKARWESQKVGEILAEGKETYENQATLLENTYNERYDEFKKLKKELDKQVADLSSLEVKNTRNMKPLDR